MLQLLRGTFPDSGMEQRQMYRQIGVLVDHIHEYLAYIQRDGKFLPTLPDQRLLLGFAWLYLAAHKFPTAAPWPYELDAGRS